MPAYTVIRERAGDGTLYEVIDPSGRVVSAHPSNWRAAHALAVFMAHDALMAAQQADYHERDVEPLIEIADPGVR
jgi:hypothetical protein